MVVENLGNLTPAELLVAHSALIHELKRRGVVRSENNPTGDYAEWLVSKQLGLTLAAKSEKGFDAVDAEGFRYQVKSRRHNADNASSQLGVIRDLESQGFDYLIAVVFDAEWNVLRAAKIPYRLVNKLATFSKRQNGHIMHMRESILSEKEVEDITRAIQG